MGSRTDHLDEYIGFSLPRLDYDWEGGKRGYVGTNKRGIA